MGLNRHPAVQKSREAVDKSRNEQQKSVLLGQVARERREALVRTLKDGHNLVAESRRLAGDTPARRRSK
jgi:hypothetical protein